MPQTIKSQNKCVCEQAQVSDGLKYSACFTSGIKNLLLFLIVVAAFISPSAFSAQTCATNQVSAGIDFLGVSGSSDNNVVTVGEDGTIYRYDGTAWVAEVSPTTEEFHAVSVVDNNTAVAVGDNGAIAIYSGGSWTNSSSGTTEDFRDVWAYADNDMYAVGKDGTLLHYDGSSWTDVSGAAGTGSEDLEAAWGDASAFYALAEDGTLYRYDRGASSWSVIPTCVSVAADDTRALWGDAAGNIYIAAKNGDVYLYDGSTCTLVATATEDLRSIYGDPVTGEVYAVGDNGAVLYYNGTSWVENIVGTEDLRGVWVSASGNVYYSAKNGFVNACLPAVVAEWRLDEAVWNGTAGEVVDSSGNGLNGVRIGSATPVAAKICNGASLNGSSDYLEIADNALLDISDKLTVMAWVQPNSIPGSGLMTILSKDENYEFHIDSSGNIYWWWRNSGNTTRDFTSSGVTLTPGTWYHIAIVYDNSGSQKIYIDGVERGAASYGENLINNNDPLQIGADQGFSGREFDGLIDEVSVYNAALDATQVATAVAATRPCPGVSPTVCTITTIPGASDLEGISGSSASNVVAIGDNGEIYRYDGTAWVTEVSPTTEEFHAVSVIDDNNAVAVGDNGAIAIYAGGSWTSSSSGTTEDFRDVWAYASNDMYAVGKNGTLLYYNGSTWTDVSGAAGTGGDDLESAWGNASYFYALQEDGTLYRYDRGAGTWSTISTCASIVGDDVTDMWGDASGNLYISGKGGAVYLYDGTSCTQVATSGEDLEGISGSTVTGEIYAVGDNGTILYFDGTTWVESTVGTEDYKDVWVSSGGVPFYAGKNGTTVTCTAVSTLSYFLIAHDLQGIHCLAETITVTAKQSGGATDTSYVGSIVLDTQSGSGSWTLNTGTGANFTDATANDGLAAYTFAVADNGVATFNLDYQSGTASINIDAYDGATRDDDSEGNLVFTASGFTVTAAPLAVPFLGAVNTLIPAQTAATDFPLYLAAYGTTPTNPTCGIIESYTGAKNLKFWSSYNNPVTGTLPVSVNAVDAFANETAANAGASQSLTFSNGQASLTLNYADVGQITLAMKDDLVTADLPTGIRGTSNAFVVRPAGFVLSAIQRSSDNFANPGTATDQNGAAFMAAGANFSVTVTAVNSVGNATPNYGQESTAESVLLTPTIVAAGAANNPAIAFATGFGSFVNGVSTGTDFRWDEVGIITLTPSVASGSYLGAGDVTGTVSANVGRFYPDHFITATGNGSFANTCAGGTAFTYLGQDFTYLGNPTVTATAQSALNNPTANYVGAWARLAIGGVSLTYPTADNSQLDENSALIGFTSTVGTLSRIDNLNGSLTFTLGGASADSFAYARDAGQVSPFTSDITIALTAVSDGEATANNTPRNITPVGNLQRFGRGDAQDVYGTMSLVGDSLTMPVGSWYFNAAGGWARNTDDACSIFSYSKVDAGIAATSLPATDVTLSSGIGDLTLTLTNSGNPGGSSVISTVWPSWLRYDLDGIDQATDSNLYDDNPAATATFGIFRGDDRYLYWREAP